MLGPHAALAIPIGRFKLTEPLENNGTILVHKNSFRPIQGSTGRRCRLGLAQGRVGCSQITVLFLAGDPFSRSKHLIKAPHSSLPFREKSLKKTVEWGANDDTVFLSKGLFLAFNHGAFNGKSRPVNSVAHVVRAHRQQMAKTAPSPSIACFKF